MLAKIDAPKMTLNEVREGISLCRNRKNPSCRFLIDYRENKKVEGASHPLLFQIVSRPKIMIIGAVPGSIDTDPAKISYQRLVNCEFSLGHKSASGLGQIMELVGHSLGVEFPRTIKEIPLTEGIQKDHLNARNRLGLHVTNLVKCNAPTKWESSCNNEWRIASDACIEQHLKYEIEIVNPKMIILLGQNVAEYFSKREEWGRDKLKISKWADEATNLPFHGRTRFVTAWCHPGGNFFWIQGKKYWNLYAEQISEFML